MAVQYLYLVRAGVPHVDHVLGHRHPQLLSLLHVQEEPTLQAELRLYSHSLSNHGDSRWSVLL